ncbi:MAG TPA: hypothetical protein VJB10_05640 [Candidatus Peribacteraceae bacterium]|nr:hypothetical protein [Candidatus Peribacteraceae bacterium]
MHKTCAHCSASFEITDDDLAYYSKISPVFPSTELRAGYGKNYPVPPPTHCPQCRQQRRYAIRNERNLHRRNCAMCKRNILSMYSPDKPFTVFCPECWWGNKWHGADYGRGIDFGRPFFEQFAELQRSVPRISLYLVNSENCDFCNFVGDCKSCYLTFGSVYSEDCLYGSAYYSKNCVDNLVTRECELNYECSDCRKLYRCLFCQDCYGSDHLLFCYDMQGCSECIACAGLRNKQYYIGNTPFSKSEYEERERKIDLCNAAQTEKLRKQLESIKLGIVRHYMPSTNVQNVSGTHIYNSKNTFQSFYVDRCEDCAYCMQVVDLKDCHDNNYTEENELCYEYLGMYGAKNTFFSNFCRHSYEVYCSDYCINSKYLFGCSGMRDKDYCILNKPYTKEAYEELVPKIIKHMKKTGEWGEFPPIALSPFCYNETVAQEYFPLTRDQALARGYRWQDVKDDMPEVQKVIAAKELPAAIEDIPDDVLHWAIRCEMTGRPFKIIRQELAFYREMRLPLPHLHPDERHKRRLALRNPRKLWQRTCGKCGEEIQTTYPPTRSETVYCEECYLAAVY